MSNEKVVFTPDWHIPFQDQEALDKFFNLLQDYQPDELVLGGNINDCSSFSHHPKKRDVAILFKTARDERKHWLAIAGRLRAILPKTKITYIGSVCHEGWIEMWATQSDILVDDPGYKIENFYHLSDFGIEFVEDEYLKNGFTFTHGTCCRSESSASAKQELIYHGTNGASGHTHRLGSFYKSSRSKPLVWFESGCMCRREAWYRLKGKMRYMDWQQGFLSLVFNDDMFAGQLVPVLRNSKDEPSILFNGNVY